MFSRTYEDLKKYDTKIIQHVIPVRTGVKPYQHPLRKMHPKLEPLIQNEVRNKSREIRLCVDFRNLNRASDKDNYPIPPMEQILQMVLDSELFSLLDGFSGYN